MTIFLQKPNNKNQKTLFYHLNQLKKCAVTERHEKQII